MTLHYQRDGKGETVVLLHGLFGSLENLGMIKRGLQDSFDVMSVDLPDHGKSPHSRQFSYAEYGDKIMQTITTNNLHNVTLLGHSMGGKVAMYIALSHPERVKRLIVADIAPVEYPPRHENVINGLQAVDLHKISSRKEAELQMANHINDPGVIQFLLRSLAKQADNRFSWRFNLALITRDYHLLSQAIDHHTPYQQPTLFIKGGNSDYLLAEHQPVINKLFPQAKAKVIQGAGHWLHAEKPSIFVKLIKDFMNEK